MDDPLQFLPMDKWAQLQKVFEQDWPRGISAYTALETQKRIHELGLDYGFKVYCPYGDVNNGMVALNKKGSSNEIIIICPQDDTGQLEEALIKTKVIDWNKEILVPFAPKNVFRCLQNVTHKLNLVLIESIEFNDILILDKKKPPFEVPSLPKDVTFGVIPEEKMELADTKWRNRYNGSLELFHLYTEATGGYGLFKNQEMVSWIFINEAGALTHLYTLEDHRRKGYAEILLKLVCNLLKEENKHVFAYCRKGNVNAFEMYMKLGFDKFHDVQWCYIKPN